jgi:drug/metabolite transporter (DMT)-like permease
MTRALEAPAAAPSRRAAALFLAVSALWGVPYALIAISLDEGFTAWTVAAGRVAVAAAALLALVLPRAGLGDLRGRWRFVVAVALLDVAAPFTLVTLAERSISSSAAGVLVASTPLWVALLALRFDRSERVGRIQLAGIAVGFGGVVLLLGLGSVGTGVVGGGTMVLLASLGYAAASLIVKQRLADVPPLPLTAATLGVATLALAPFALADLPDRSPTTGGWAALLALGLACTAVAFGLFYALIAQAGAGRAALITYVAPIFAVLLGVLALDEGFTVANAVGIVLILGGAWLAARPAGDGYGL